MRPWIHHRQETDVTCGPASARMLLARYGRCVDEAAIATWLDTDEHGTRPWNVAAGLCALGLPATPGDGGWDGLRTALVLGHDAMVCYELPDHGVDHYALVRTMDAHGVRLCDPIYGPRHELSRQRFERDWVGTSWHDGPRDQWWLDVRPGFRT